MTTTFELPAGLEATAPPADRSGVRLLVAHPGGVEHARFPALGTFLSPGDLLVVNTSGTLAAAIDGIRHDSRAVTVHFATALDDGSWVVEVRPAGRATGPVPDSGAGDVITLPDDVRVALVQPHPSGQIRLWHATIGVEGGAVAVVVGVVDLDDDPQAARSAPPAPSPAAPRMNVRRLLTLRCTPWPASLKDSTHSATAACIAGRA